MTDSKREQRVRLADILTDESGLEVRESAGQIEEAFSHLEEAYKSALPNDEEQAGASASEAERLIEYFDRLSEAQKNRHMAYARLSVEVVAITLPLLASAIAGLSTVIPFVREAYQIAAVVGVLSVLFVLLAGSVSCLWVHNRQNSFRYPFLKLSTYSNTWKWFYYGALTEPRGLRSALCGMQRVERIVHFLEDQARYVRKFAGQSETERLKVNLQQLFLVLVVNGYQNRFTLELARIWRVSTSIVAALIVATLVVGGLLSVLS